MTQTCGLMFGLLALLIAGRPAAQTTYPEKPIRMVVGFPPGGAPDTVARLLGLKLAEALGKSIVVDNATGAAGNIATERVAKAAPDGYTLGLLVNGQLVINPSLYKLPFDPVKDMRHVPYKGGVAAIPDLLGGRVTMMFIPIVAVLPVVREGKLRALAVTSLKRSSAVPELPTIAESGYPGFDYTSWGGLFAPARTPATIVHKLHLETVKALALPDLRAKLADLGVEGVGSSPDELAALIKSEIPKWAKVIKESGIKPD